LRARLLKEKAQFEKLVLASAAVAEEMETARHTGKLGNEKKEQ